MGDIPFAPLILASVTDNTPDGIPVLTFQTKLTKAQTEDIEKINQVVTLMKETMEEILSG